MLRSQFIHYLNRKSIHVYLGIGPMGGYNYSYDERDGPFIDIPQLDITESRTWTVGINILSGVEYYVNKSISFMAEYGLDIEYEKILSGKNKNPDRTLYRYGEYYLYRIAAIPVKFGISLYS